MRGRGALALLVPVPAALLAGCEGGAGPSIGDIELPPGFRIELYAEGVVDARSLALGARGTVFVGSRDAGVVYAVLPHGTESARRPLVLARDLYLPNGVAFHDGDLYVAEVHRVLRYPGIEARLEAPPEPIVVADDFPRDRHHGWRYIGFGPDDKLYLAIGAPCNVCNEPGYAVILRMNPDGSAREVYARGVRNSVGFDWHPDTGELWFTDNGRDWLGDDRPADELNRASRAGLDFGFPYCHAGTIEDPDHGDLADCADSVPPVQRLGPHVAALGMKFYTGSMFPGEYRGQVFIAEHGSWNRSRSAGRTGYRLTRVRLEDGTAVSYRPFARGWLTADGEVRGRPVDLLELPDGSLLASDDAAGVIYRISYR